MTFGELYRDVYSLLGLQGNRHPVSSLDILKAINHTIKRLRVEYVQNGAGHTFAVTERMFVFIDDFDYPNFKVGQLGGRIMSEVPVHDAVMNVTIKITNNVLQDTPQTFNEGDLVEFENKLYEAVRDINDENTYGLLFDGSDLRLYRPGNGLKYKRGEYVLNSDDDKFYEVTDDFVAKVGTEHTREIVWRYLGKSDHVVDIYPFNELRNITLHDTTLQAASVVNDSIYVNLTAEQGSITYIPEWENVADLDMELNLPDSMVLPIIEGSLNKLTYKSGGPVNE